MCDSTFRDLGALEDIQEGDFVVPLTEMGDLSSLGLRVSSGEYKGHEIFERFHMKPSQYDVLSRKRPGLMPDDPMFHVAFVQDDGKISVKIMERVEIVSFGKAERILSKKGMLNPKGERITLG